MSIYREGEVNDFQWGYFALLQGVGNEGFFRVVIESLKGVEMEWL